MRMVSATSSFWLFPFRVFFWASGMGAITVSSRLAIAKDDAHVADENLCQHEFVHMRQFRRHGWLGFVIRYFWQCLRHGYTNNPFEVEAREMSRLWRRGPATGAEKSNEE
jgi:hypothetical protein